MNWFKSSKTSYPCAAGAPLASKYTFDQHHERENISQKSDGIYKGAQKSENKDFKRQEMHREATVSGVHGHCRTWNRGGGGDDGSGGVVAVLVAVISGN